MSELQAVTIGGSTVGLSQAKVDGLVRTLTAAHERLAAPWGSSLAGSHSCAVRSIWFAPLCCWVLDFLAPSSLSVVVGSLISWLP